MTGRFLLSKIEAMDGGEKGSVDAAQTLRDADHLRLLSIFYVLSGAVSLLFALLPLVYVGLGVFFLHGVFPSSPSEKTPQPEWFGWLFVAFGAAAFVLFASITTLKFFAAHFLRKRRHRVFCLVVAGLTCLGIPYGTVLGVCTLLVLERKSVVAEFARNAANAPASAGP
jgi:hypothetical protein